MSENKFKTGDLVTVRRGKHTGTQFVIVSVSGDDVAYISDGVNYKVERPKKKNILHLQKTLTSLEDVAERVAGGKPLDNGWLKEKISASSKHSNTSCT
ncbi:MAG: KOW domain-containing RNA-binding protein [Synergistaceae bacterium]